MAALTLMAVGRRGDAGEELGRPWEIPAGAGGGKPIKPPPPSAWRQSCTAGGARAHTPARVPSRAALPARAPGLSLGPGPARLSLRSRPGSAPPAPAPLRAPRSLRARPDGAGPRAAGAGRGPGFTSGRLGGVELLRLAQEAEGAVTVPGLQRLPRDPDALLGLVPVPLHGLLLPPPPPAAAQREGARSQSGGGRGGGAESGAGRQAELRSLRRAHPAAAPALPQPQRGARTGASPAAPSGPRRACAAPPARGPPPAGPERLQRREGALGSAPPGSGSAPAPAGNRRNGKVPCALPQHCGPAQKRERGARAVPVLAVPWPCLRYRLAALYRPTVISGINYTRALMQGGTAAPEECS